MRIQETDDQEKWLLVFLMQEFYRCLRGPRVVLPTLQYVEAMGLLIIAVKTDVPFSTVCRRVSGITEIRSHKDKFRGQLTAFRRVICGYPRLMRISPGKDRVPGRHA